MSHDKKQGFTLIELMLAMTFIAVLLVAIAVTTIQISAIYTKGITLREVNQAGRSISDELQRSIASVSPFDVTKKVDDSAETKLSKFVVRDGGGRLCIGRYTYAWNYGSTVARVEGAPSVFNEYAGLTDEDAIVRFAKVDDPGSDLCAHPAAKIDRTKATEMLASGDRELVLHDFDISAGPSDKVTGQALYTVSLVIGTNDNDQLETVSRSCKPPAEGAGKENYCSVNQFDIVARAGNKTGGKN